MRRNGLLLGSLSMLLAACSGGASQGPGAGSVVVVAPTPTPASATPTPSPSYDLAYDFTRDRSFAAISAQARHVMRYASDVPPYYRLESSSTQLEAVQTAASLDYQNGAQTLSIRFTTETVAFAGTDITLRNADALAYGRTLTTTDPQEYLGIDLRGQTRYVTVARQERQVALVRGPTDAAGYALVHRFYVFGAPTLLTDLPATGNSAYTGSLITSPATGPNGISLYSLTAAVQVNHATGATSGSIPVRLISSQDGVPDITATFTFTGTFNAATNQISGTVTSPDSSYAGTFGGRLYGPGGTEIGIVFTVTPTTGLPVAGEIVAKR